MRMSCLFWLSSLRARLDGVDVLTCIEHWYFSGLPVLRSRRLR
jgi:hypothetical protein